MKSSKKAIILSFALLAAVHSGPALAGSTIASDGELWLPDELASHRIINRVQSLEDLRTESYLELKILKLWWRAYVKTDQEALKVTKKFDEIESKLQPEVREAILSVLEPTSITIKSKTFRIVPADRLLVLRSADISILRLGMNLEHLRRKQENFLSALRKYVERTAEFRDALTVQNQLDHSLNATWSNVDPRILITLQNHSKHRIRFAASSALAEKKKFLKVASESLLKNADLAFGGKIDWKNAENLASTDLTQTPQDNLTSEMGRYLDKAHTQFQEKFSCSTTSPVLLAKIGRDGRLLKLSTMQSSGRTELDDEARSIASKLTLPPLPPFYSKDHLYVIFRAFPAIPQPPDVEAQQRNQSAEHNTEGQSSLNLQTDFEAKKLRYGIKHPWEMTIPYTTVRER